MDSTASCSFTDVAKLWFSKVLWSLQIAATLSYVLFPSLSSQIPLSREDGSDSCQETDVAILGAGMAGISAGDALTKNGVHDFMIIEYNNHIGGRVLHTQFGHKPDGSPYVVELGANWVQGLGTPSGPENPIWRLAQRYNVANTYSNYSDILTYNESGHTDYTRLLHDYETHYAFLEQEAGDILRENLLDRNAKCGLSLAGWNPRNDMKKEAVDWWEWDWEYAFAPEQSSQLFGIVNYNTTFYQWSDRNNYVYDQRGFNTFIRGLASQYLTASDPRLHLNKVAKNIAYDNNGVTIRNSDDSCIRAKHAICTFSLGVLQASLADKGPVSFKPHFPAWKKEAIDTFDMGIYTKIFLQFNTTKHGQFWPKDKQFFLYASPTTRGYYPVWQSLSTPGFLENSGIIFVTVVTPESRRVEAQSDEVTMKQVMEVLRQMYGKHNVPDPIAFMYPRWGKTEWAYGSYSNWPIGVTLEQHQNLRANLNNLWFAGEAGSTEYYGFLQGAYTDGRNIAGKVAKCLKHPEHCKHEMRYEVLKGTTTRNEYSRVNGWDVSSFQTNGF